MEPNKRARDIDRATVATALDSAYAEGQLTYDEHRLRQQKVSAAVYLEDLRAVTGDLQSVADIAEPAPIRREPKRRLLYALGAVVVLAAAVTVFTLERNSQDEPSPAAASGTSVVVKSSSPVLPAGVTPIIARPFVFDSPAGLDDFRAQYVARFGSSEVVEISIQPDESRRADIYRDDADGTYQRVFVQDGFDPKTSSVKRDVDARPFDWIAVDSGMLADLLAGVRVSGAEVEYVSIRDRGRPEIAFSTRANGESGRVVFDFAGNLISIT